MFARIGIMLIEGAVMAVGWKLAETIVARSSNAITATTQTITNTKREIEDKIDEIKTEHRRARRAKLMRELERLNHDPNITVIDIKRGNHAV